MPLKDPKKRREYERQRKRNNRKKFYESLPEPERSEALARLRGPYVIGLNRY